MKYLLTLLLLLGLSAQAADIVTATVTVTNTAGTTNGQTITVNAAVRTWTNNVVVSASQILTNNTIGGAATNLFNHVAANPFTKMNLGRSGTNGITLRSDPGIALTVTLSAGWGDVAYATQSLTTAIALRLPITVEAAAQQTNLSTRLVDALNLTAPTNQFMQSRPAFAQLVGTTNAQTISGSKTWSGTNTFTGEFTVTNSRATIRMGDSLSQKTLVISNNFDTELTLEATGDGPGFDSPGQRLVTIAADGSVGTPSWADGVEIDGEGLTNLNAAALVGIVPEASLSNNIPRLNADGGLSVYATGTNSFSDIAFRRYTITSLANGNNAGIVIGTNTFVEVSGPSAAFAINGMTGSPSRDGHLVVVVNQTGFDMTIAHQSGTDPTAANRIISMTGADRSTTGNGAATLIYSASASRWLLISLDP